MPDVIVVGDIDTDTFYIVPHIPQWDEGVLVKEVFERPGGKGANTASALSHLGVDTGIISAVGNDHFGDVGIAGLRTNNVDITGVQILDGLRTYYCIMMLDPSGEKAILVVDTDLIYPTSKILEDSTDYLLNAKHAHFIGIDPLRMVSSMQKAKEAGLSVSVDLDAAYTGLDACARAIQWSDIVFVNRQGACTLYPDLETEEILRRIKSFGPTTVLITSGNAGAAGISCDEVCTIPSFKVPVVDTTGAGDIFSASFLFAYLQKWDLKKSMIFASASAAISVAKIGGQSALSTQDEILQFINNYPLESVI